MNDNRSNEKTPVTFHGFYPETADVLWGIRLNNHKSWFDAHRAEYQKFVHEPMAALGQELFRRFQEHDENFKDYPKVSRAARDTRFTKNKDPYKETKWIMFREDGTPTIEHYRPSYFFEIFPEKYWFGLGYWPEAKGMARFREHIDENPVKAIRLAEEFAAQDFFQIDGDLYKKKKGTHLPPLLQEWYDRKGITLMHENEGYEDLLMKPELVDFVAEKFISLYDYYLYFNEVAFMAEE